MFTLLIYALMFIAVIALLWWGLNAAGPLPQPVKILGIVVIGILVIIFIGHLLLSTLPLMTPLP